MATSLSQTTLDELADLERDFEEVEKKITRQHYCLSKPLYARLADLTARIPNIWGRMLKQALIDLDEYIQTSDLELLSHSLKSLSVTRFEIDADEKKGDPRSVAIRFEFANNKYFKDTVLEKRFWWRQNKYGFAGLVSEPVEIEWKKGKDLTDGRLGLTKAAFDEQQAKPDQELTGKRRALEEKIDETDIRDVSFFDWFGYIGEYISAEESRTVIDKEKEERRRRKVSRAQP
ncbi:nucleosome assembly protein [Parachaetomium inaequale]|uniref:Nucleosome assembly protein n=1 Tax=Parachaetomium inaequale TaxID=2588326 RepID=A0AAN6P3W5_9PEZI|nr:nucleosome assembly protein [Parachaetomium inaequale]